MSDLEQRQAKMRERFKSSFTRRPKPQLEYSVDRKRVIDCFHCEEPFVTIGSKICGLCQARAVKNVTIQ